jgi:hypothetical protein
MELAPLHQLKGSQHVIAEAVGVVDAIALDSAIILICAHLALCIDGNGRIGGYGASDHLSLRLGFTPVSASRSNRRTSRASRSA